MMVLTHFCLLFQNASDIFQLKNIRTQMNFSPLALLLQNYRISRGHSITTHKQHRGIRQPLILSGVMQHKRGCPFVSFRHNYFFHQNNKLEKHAVVFFFAHWLLVYSDFRVWHILNLYIELLFAVLPAYI